MSRAARRRRALAGALMGVLAPVLLLAGCSGAEPADGARSGRGTAQARPAPLPTVRAERRDFAETLPWFGTAVSRQAVTVVALQAGRIVAVEADDGAAVHRGDLLFRLGGPAAARRRAALQEKVAALEKRARAAGKTVELRRQALAEQLVRRDELLAAEGDLAGVRQDLAAARQELAAEGSALALRAPAGGTFTGRRVSVGQDVAAGEDLARIVDATSLRVVASLHLPPGISSCAGPPGGASRQGSCLEGAPVVFDDPDGGGSDGEASGGPDGSGGPGGPDRVGGRIVRVLPDRSPTGAVTVWIDGGSAVSGLGPGESVSGTVRLAVQAGAVAVPEGAVARDEQDRPFVFVPGPAGSGGEETRYERRGVTTGLAADGWVEVTSGLDAGTEVVSEGAYELLFRDFGATYRVPD